MTAPALRRLASAASLAFAAVLAACSGSVGPSPVVNDPLVITIQPAVATIYPGVPTTLLITGGTGSYVVASDNQAIVPIVSAGVGHSLTVTANPVSADTIVNLTVRDTGTTPQKTVVLTVKPGTIANAVTIVPASASCNPALCSGGEALVTATISQSGVPLPSRGMRFDVVSGDIRIITTPAGTTPEVLALTQSTTADQNGQARVRIRALTQAPDQNALLQITDPDTGAYQRFVVVIRQFTGTGNPSFFTVPTSMTFTGPFVNQCANNVSAGVGIFGGTPPYNILSTAPGVVNINPDVVPNNGGRFVVNLFTATCLSNVPITITDASGRTLTVTVTNQAGTATAPPTPVAVAPTSLTLGCGQTASIIVSGGNVPISASSSSGLVNPVVVVDRTVSFTRVGAGAGSGGTTTAIITVTDGVSSAGATITIPAVCP